MLVRVSPRTTPGSTYTCYCVDCNAKLSSPVSARRHAREQRHLVRIMETVDARNAPRP